MLPAAVRALGSDPAALARAFDAARGVAVVTYVDDPSGESKTDADGAVKDAEKLCAIAKVGEVLRRALEVKEVPGNGRCEGEPRVCTILGSHDVPTTRLTFVGARGDAVGTLVSIAELQEATMGESWLAKAAAYERAQLAALARRRCR